MAGRDIPTALRAVLWTVVFLGIAATCGVIWIQPDSTQWDFRIYRAAALAHAQGMDPYDLDDLSRAAGREVQLGFVYPPASLWVWRPFLELPYVAAARLWLGLQLVAAAGLLWIWRRFFLPRVAPVILAAVAVFAFHASLLWGLRTGNVAPIEQFLLWAGFAAFLRRRIVLFVILVTLASAFKLLPVVFLVLAVVRPPRRWWPPAMGLAALAAIVLLPAAVAPGLWTGFTQSLAGERAYGLVNPSLLGLADHALSFVPGAPPWLAPALWAAGAAALLGMGRPLLRAAADPRTGDPAAVVMITLALAVVAPRLMVYTYVLLVPAILLLGARAAGRWGARGWVPLLLCAQGATMIPPRELSEVLSANAVYLAALGLWALVVVRLRVDPEFARVLGRDARRQRDELGHGVAEVG